ncbi:hypothetical protein Fmac_025328 [Flemingia macrophylla]|uniref:S-locus receptor kinase C-terminal domain-containing protein n=1 Tax=Flemingia macrophylla TaxID=520843 RepID=A0ABD1LTM6_9FABA
MDPVLEESCEESEVVKCIHIGLLCVQEDAADRPTMSTVVVMLASDKIDLPKPNQPAFSVGRITLGDASTSKSSKNLSINNNIFIPKEFISRVYNKTNKPVHTFISFSMNVGEYDADRITNSMQSFHYALNARLDLPPEAIIQDFSYRIAPIEQQPILSCLMRFLSGQISHKVMEMP